MLGFVDGKRLLFPGDGLLVFGGLLLLPVGGGRRLLFDGDGLGLVTGAVVGRELYVVGRGR